MDGVKLSLWTASKRDSVLDLFLLQCVDVRCGRLHQTLHSLTPGCVNINGDKQMSWSAYNSFPSNINYTKGHRGAQSGCNECFTMLTAQEKGQASTRVMKRLLDMLTTYTEALWNVCTCEAKCFITRPCQIAVIKCMTGLNDVSSLALNWIYRPLCLFCKFTLRTQYGCVIHYSTWCTTARPWVTSDMNLILCRSQARTHPASRAVPRRGILPRVKCEHVCIPFRGSSISSVGAFSDN